MKKRITQKRLSIFLTAILLVQLLLPAATMATAKTQAGVSNLSTLIISEYVEGSGSNKAIELYNGTGVDVDLSEYSLELYSNGSVEVTQSLGLTGTLANERTYVIYNHSSVDEIKNVGDLANSQVINFNGDDALVLKKSDQVVDSIGQVGERVNNLADVTLVRNSDVTSGDLVIDDAFDPSLGWTSFPSNTFDYLGTHTVAGEPDTPVATELFISQYIEGGSFNKALEIFNGTGEAVNLEGYTLALHTNGAADNPKTLDLSGTLENGDVYVLYHNQSAEEIKTVGDLADSNVINFNGNDPIVLMKNGEVVDSMGQVGNSADTMKDVTLVRNPDITTGDTVIDDAFDYNTEWTNLGKDNFENLGEHSFGEGNEEEPNPEEPVEIITIAEARAQATGEAAVEGVVTAVLKNTIHIQDETAAIALYPSSLNVQLGDKVHVRGGLTEYNGLLQLQGTEVVENHGQVGVPTPVVLTGAELNETNESKLASVQNVTLVEVTEGNGWANYTATDGTTDFLVRDELGILELSVGTTYELISGIVQEFNGEFQIIPRGQTDIVADSSIVQNVTANPAAGLIPSGTEVTLSTLTEDAEIFYTINGDDPKVNGVAYTAPIVVDQNMTIKAYAVKDGLTDSKVSEFTYSVFEQEEGMQIHHIQGEQHESPLKGQMVTGIEGVVTYTYTLSGANYFHFQTPDAEVDDNPNTSEGLVVYTGRNSYSVKVGDLVRVTGTVDEYQIDGYSNTKFDTDLAVTQLNARDDKGGNVEVVASDVALPTAIIINDENLPSDVIDNDGFGEFDPEEDAIDFWESLEGMLVQVGTVKAVAPQEHGDLITVLENRVTDTIHGGVLFTEEDANADRIQFKLYDNNAARDFNVITGDRFTGPITGVVNYGFNNYKIYVDLEDMQAAHESGETTPEVTNIVKDGEKLTVASYNLENFSNNKSSTPDSKAKKLARAIANDMQSPDIVGVTEVQDNNGQDAGDSRANESYERLIAAIEAAGGVRYEYVNIDPENNQDGGAPDANIRVGFLYNPDRVGLTEGADHGDATTAVGYEDGKLTVNPGRIDPTNEAFDDSRKPLAAQFDFNGESVVVIANHWNSKSGDTPLFGSTQPPVYNSEIQRRAIAEVIAGFIEEVKVDNPDANIVSLGDFNDFQFSDALAIHEGEHMINMINLVPDSDRYTYLFQGNSQVLDHILVSTNLASQTEIDILHVNADFTDMAGRASDHDPVMVQIGFTDNGEEPGEPEEPIDTTIDRIKGKDRYQTAIEISKKGWDDDSVDKVILASGKNFADSLTGVPFASAWNAPILLTDGQKISSETLAEISRLGANKVYVLGGIAAVSEKVEQALEDADLKVTRISGKDRFETAVEIAKLTPGRTAGKAVVVNGMNYADSVSIAAIAAHEGLPILLTKPNQLPNATDTALDRLGVTETVVVGGEAAVSAEVTAEMPGVTRLSGKDRYETNVAVLEAFNVTGEKLYVATGKEFADSLTGAVLAEQKGTAILLVHNIVPASAANFVTENGFTDLTIFGGEAAVSDAVKQGLESIVTLPDEETPGEEDPGEEDPGEEEPGEDNPGEDNPGEDNPVDEYYEGAYGKEGTALKAALHEIIDDHHELSYSEVWNALKITDEDPNNPNNVLLFYSGESRSKDRNGGNSGDWNREHTWAKSHGDFGTSKGPGTDIHHLRPTDVQVNSFRSNYDFDYGGTAGNNICDQCKHDNDSFEPPNEVKGDVARILFYMAVRYENGDRVDLELNDRVNNGKNPYHGKLSVLLEWHEQDPVSDWERSRNDKIQEIQGNRNPFIDYPEWANSIWN